MEKSFHKQIRYTLLWSQRKDASHSVILSWLLYAYCVHNFDILKHKNAHIWSMFDRIDITSVNWLWG